MSSLHIIICLSSPSLFLFSFLTEDIFHPIKKFSFVSVLLSIIQDYLAKKLLVYIFNLYFLAAATAAVKSLQSCPTLCDPIDSSPPGSLVPGILQVRTLEWVAISFSNAWKWKVKVKSLSRDSSRPQGLQPTRLLYPWDLPGKSTGVGCHCLLCYFLASLLLKHFILRILYLFLFTPQLFFPVSILHLWFYQPLQPYVAVKKVHINQILISL